jgi:hypothetical protein
MRKADAERTILYPLGLNVNTFLARQAHMNSAIVHDLKEALLAHDLPGHQEAIFMGIDNDGPVSDKGEKLAYPQLYVTDADRLAWLNTVGFAAIGIGRSHAESQLMYSGHAPLNSFEQTVLFAYAAKKRSEVAPGVGKETDICVVGPGLGTFHKVEDEHVAGIERIFQKSRISIERIHKRTLDETKTYIEEIRKYYVEKQKQAEKQQQAESPAKENQNDATTT